MDDRFSLLINKSRPCFFETQLDYIRLVCYFNIGDYAPKLIYSTCIHFNPYDNHTHSPISLHIYYAVINCEGLITTLTIFSILEIFTAKVTGMYSS